MILVWPLRQLCSLLRRCRCTGWAPALPTALPLAPNSSSSGSSRWVTSLPPCAAGSGPVDLALVLGYTRVSCVLPPHRPVAYPRPATCSRVTLPRTAASTAAQQQGQLAVHQRLPCPVVLQIAPVHHATAFPAPATSSHRAIIRAPVFSVPYCGRLCYYPDARALCLDLNHIKRDRLYAPLPKS